MKPVRALVSVSDKTGIVEFAKFLEEFGVEIISTGVSWSPNSAPQFYHH